MSSAFHDANGPQDDLPQGAVNSREMELLLAKARLEAEAVQAKLRSVELELQLERSRLAANNATPTLKQPKQPSRASVSVAPRAQVLPAPPLAPKLKTPKQVSQPVRSRIAPDRHPPKDESAAGAELTPKQSTKCSVWLQRLSRRMPAWLVSAAVHLVLLIVLALMTLKALKTPSPGELLAAVEDEQAIEDVALESPPVELDELEPVAAMDFSPVTSEQVAIGSDAGESVSIDANTDAARQVGQLFDGGVGMSASPASTAAAGAEFFGVKSHGVKFVFIVDSSNSMRGGKFDAARAELSYAIRRLSSKQMFYVIFFDQDAYRMFDLKKPEPWPLPATTPNLARLDKWLPTVENELRTDPYEAVKFAMEMLPDAMYILSDGKFTDKGKTEEYLKRVNKIDYPVDNRTSKVLIHTIAFWDQAGEPTLKGIADASGGTYRFVPRPAK